MSRQMLSSSMRDEKLDERDVSSETKNVYSLKTREPVVQEGVQGVELKSSELDLTPAVSSRCSQRATVNSRRCTYGPHMTAVQMATDSPSATQWLGLYISSNTRLIFAMRVSHTSENSDDFLTPVYIHNTPNYHVS
ncbi:hypothetical protein PROFUN_00859 [Planoprotostelium fungivorum]|uniref:Uncharacterized protein n=1 Tax=Planoprotostelium fungivorum TaxID=1890364 RepID=A0A2P6P053_9EUKA|nr:hypothetical protein PROFUN_00859 [Planoprotostelium fungivorum]